MGLSENEKIFGPISLKDAYDRIKEWYKSNLDMIQDPNSEYGKNSIALIKFLPDYKNLSQLEVRAILGEVIYGYLEWAYHESDKNYKMGAYAHGGLENNRFNWYLSENEKLQLENSRIWNLLMISR